MTIIDYLLFLLIIGFGSYVQTSTGFALALIAIGIISAIDLIPLETATIVISFVALTNSIFALKGHWHAIHKDYLLRISLGLFPATLIGVWLLSYMTTSATDTLRVILGGFIIIAALALLIQPNGLKQVSPSWTFTAAGSFAGLAAGLFSIGGPPIVLHLYRQPIHMATIRHLLLAVFALSSSTRITYLAIDDRIDSNTLLLSAIAFPAVFVATRLAKRCPPPFSQTTLKRVIFALLIVIGISLLTS